MTNFLIGLALGFVLGRFTRHKPRPRPVGNIHLTVGPVSNK